MTDPSHGRERPLVPADAATDVPATGPDPEPVPDPRAWYWPILDRWSPREVPEGDGLYAATLRALGTPEAEPEPDADPDAEARS